VQRTKINTSYPALFSPMSNWICLGFIGVVLYIMWHKGFNESVLMLPIWLGLMYTLFRLLGLNKSSNHPSDDVDS
jgi:AAT family amino acid transporter/aromatic amino acid transport protein AroP